MALIAGGMAFSASALAHEPSYTAMMANTCNGCHGTDGVSAGPNMPNLGGVPANYMVEQMKLFKSGERPSSVMGRLAKGYSEGDFTAMAKYFAAMKYVGAKQPVDDAKAARGKVVHEERCEKCHEKGGSVGADEGILAGQWLEYLQISMNEFRSGKRPMPKKMAAKIEGEGKLSDADVEALVHFYASQH